MRRLNKLGFGLVYRDPHTGELIVDTDNIRPAPAASTGFFGGVDEEDYADFADDEEDADFGDDEGDDDDDYEFGRRRRGPRRKRRRERRARRSGRPSRRPRHRDPVPVPTPAMPTKQWGTTAIGGVDKNAEGGAVSVKVRLQHDFRARDITFTGSTDSAKVTSIFFGDRVVWSNSDGISVGVFSANSFMRNFLEGQSLRAGLDITVNGSVDESGVFSVTLLGSKPVRSQC